MPCSLEDESLVWSLVEMFLTLNTDVWLTGW
uniref:Uncharacterized protein n=1 Tax=Anguilla anguilla TaxID=7936 RepID=A0A0E9TPK3_ANGAN